MSLEGQQLGRYHLQQVLGMGGMGEVYLATDSVIHRQVAIKVIRDEASAYPNPTMSQESARLFQREMKAIATLDHPHILPLYDYGEENVKGAKLSYLVMPYRPEGTLATWLQQRPGGGLLPLAVVAFLVEQAADALQHAHDHQIIHQDVKPSNFLLRVKREDPDHPDLLLADFGVSKFSSATANVSQSIRGTPASMAPEQWEGHPVPATDQYALAVMAYELLTGRPPFQGGLSQLMYQHFHAMPPRPGSINPRLPAEIDDVLLHALAKRPEQRFANIAAFGRAFQQAALSGAQTMVDDFQPVNPPTPFPTPHLTPLPTPHLTPIPPPPPAPGTQTDIYAVLAISPAEARSGGSRTITLPGGRQMMVPLPAGAVDGQIISLQDRQGPGSAPMTLNLRLSIQQTDSSGAISAPGSADQTMRGASSEWMPPAQPARQPTGEQRPVVPAAPITPVVPIAPPPPGIALGSQNLSAASNIRQSGPAYAPKQAGGTGGSEPGERPRRRASTPKLRTALLVGLALLLVLGSIGIFAAVRNGQAATASANATAQAQATAFPKNATSTANANVQATQVAQYYGMLTATATAFQNLYSGSTSGNPNLNDPLGSNMLGYGWQEGTFNPGGACKFSGNAYHVSITAANYYQPCIAGRTNFANFAFEVQMKIINGDCGGLIFRGNSANGQFYYLRICQDGAYALWDELDSYKSQSTELTSGNSSAVTNGLNQTNQITVVAKGNTITFYVNRQGVDSVTSNTYSHGEIGLVADYLNSATEVAYSYAKVWVL
ncbi:MAG TPA: protein kinase [Ktedonobacteraceae bacterium]|nr:protein kinase [Ktedonobacteraceae bacterium]